MNNKQTFYDEFYKTHGPKVHDDPIRFNKLADLCRGSVLDLGCGTGTLADFYKGEYTGVDISSVAIESAKSVRRPGANFICSDIADYRLLQKKQFDTIVVAEVLEHIADDKEIYDNITRLLVPNGRLIISVPNGDRVPDADHCRIFTVPSLRARLANFGRVSFHNYPGFKQRIIVSVDFGERVSHTLGLAMIAKNEGAGIEDAILSCINFVDEICIAVDTKSEDNTKEIAQLYADKFSDYFWENSFCKARNFVQKMSKSEWVLILDGHEFVDQAPDLTKYLNSQYTGVKTTVKLENGFKFQFPRILRQNVEWKKDVHNWPDTPKNALCEEFVVVHDREGKQAAKYREIRDKQRDEMIIEHMTAEIKRDPKAFSPWYYLGQHYFLAQNFKKAIKMYNQYLKRSTWKGERWLVYYDMAQAHAFQKHFVRALRCLRLADREIPNRWETNFLRGLIYIMWQVWDKAMENLLESFNTNPGKFTYYPLQKDDAGIWYHLGYCCEKLGRSKEAFTCYFRSFQLERKKPEKEQNKERLKILEFELKVALSIQTKNFMPDEINQNQEPVAETPQTETPPTEPTTPPTEPTAPPAE